MTRTKLRQKHAEEVARLTAERDHMLAFVVRVSRFRPMGLFGQAEDDVAGLRHDAEWLLSRVAVPLPDPPAVEASEPDRNQGHPPKDEPNPSP